MTSLTLGRKSLIYFSLPLIFGSILEPLAGLVDTAFVGQLKTDWLAALAQGTMILSAFAWVFNFLIHVSTESISRSVATNDLNQKFAHTQIALIVSLVFGIIGALVMWGGAPVWFYLMGVNQDLGPFVESYFNIRLIGHPLLILYGTMISILRGFGRIKVCLVILFLTVAINSLLTGYLLFIMKLGIEGAAWGTNISSLCGVLFCFFFILQEVSWKSFFSEVYFTAKQLSFFGEKSLNLFFRSLCLTTMFFLSTRFCGQMGTKELAAHQILLQFWLFSSFFIDGVAMTANIYGARLTENKNLDGFLLMKKELLLQGIFFGTIFSVVYFVARDFLFSLFTQDRKVLALMYTIWPLICLGQMVNSYAFVYDGVLFGAGSFRNLRNMMLVGLFIVYLPISLVGVYYQSIVPIWMALIALSIFRWGWSREIVKKVESTTFA